MNKHELALSFTRDN